MPSKPPKAKSKRIRHRIKEIELQPITSSKYPISVKVFVDEKEVCELPPIESGQDLRWSRPIVCRNASPQAKVTLEICEIHTIIDRSFKSQPYVISEVEDQVEAKIGFAGTGWTAKVTMLTPKTVEQSHAEVLRQLKETELAPSAMERLGTAQKLFSAVLDFGNIVADAHPAAKLVFSISTVVWEKLKEEDQLKGDTQKLLVGLTDIAELCEPVKKTTKMKQLKDIIDDILILLEDAFIYVIEHESSGSGGTMQVLRRVFDPRDQEMVEGLLGRYKRLRKQFNSGVGVDIHGTVHKLDLQGLLDKLQPVSSAGYNLDRACQHGTRENIIADIMDWTEHCPDVTQEFHNMLWIHGQAGMGKSAIASSACGKLNDTGTLAASFFCKRDGGSDLHDPLRLINTIAYSLANRCPEYAEAVAAAIEGDRDLCMTNTLHDRYEGLIGKPLGGLKELAMPHPLIVMIDALDEFGTSESRQNVMKPLWNMSQLVPWLKIVITSRPEEDIKGFFEQLGEALISSLNVHDFDATDDIHAYFQNELDRLAAKRGWEWPESSINRLSERADGLFIWASTVKRYIEGSVGFKIAVQRLNNVLEGRSKHHALDKLYEKVIEDAMKDTDDDNREAFCQCIGAVIVASTRQPLSLTDLCSLLHELVDIDILGSVVKSLGAVIHVDKQADDALRFYHQSFVDYATDRPRSGRFYVNPGERNAELAAACLKAMEQELKFNICGLETSHLFNDEVPDIDERVESKISSRLGYSCVYWISHLVDTPKGTLKNEVEELFNAPQVLYWLEVLSLLSQVDVGLIGLLELSGWLLSEQSETRESAMDLYRFTSAFFDAISASAPHLYVSALALAPESSRIVRHLGRFFPNTVALTRGGDKSWPDWLRTLSHSAGVSSSAISPDGRRLVTGCKDGMILLWDMRTGAQVGEPLVGHSENVASVAFSPDGSLIASGSWDSTVRIWDGKTYTEIEELVGHSRMVTSVAFSPSGNLLVSGSWDNTVRIWDVTTRAAIGEPLVGHSASLNFVAFSPNSDLIASAACDDTVRIWDTKLHAEIGQPLAGLCLAFSPKGDLIASGGQDETVQVWDAKTRVAVGSPLVGHSHIVACVAFSSHGEFIASGSFDMTVRLWDTKTRIAIGGPLVGHSARVSSVTFSPSSDLIVSSSDDNTVRIWDVKTCSVIREPFFGPPHSINSVALSPAGDLFVSGSDDNTARLWDAKTGAAIGNPLVGHSGSVGAVAYSPNGNLIVSGSSDKTLRLWDAESGTMIGEPFVGHSAPVNSIAFSPDGSSVVSGSRDKTVRVWDTTTHALIGEPLVGHSGPVNSVAFSPNGDLIASGSEDFTVRIWDTKSGVMISEPLVGDSYSVLSVAFSPDGRLIASGSMLGTRQIWDVETGSAIGEPLGPRYGPVISLVFSTDGDLLVSGEVNGTVCRWDVKAGTEVSEPLVGHSSHVNSVALSPNGNLIISGSEDGTLRIWNAKPPAPVHPVNLQSLWPLSLCGLPPLSENEGWVSLDDESLLLWLPMHYRRPYDTRALHCISNNSAKPTILFDFSKFVHGPAWTSIASEPRSALQGSI